MWILNVAWHICWWAKVLIWWATTGTKETQRGGGWKAIQGGYKGEWCNWEQSLYVKQPIHFQKNPQKNKGGQRLCYTQCWPVNNISILTRKKQVLKLNQELERKNILWLFNPSFQHWKRPLFSMVRCLYNSSVTAQLRNKGHIGTKHDVVSLLDNTPVLQYQFQGCVIEGFHIRW